MGAARAINTIDDVARAGAVTMARGGGTEINGVSYASNNRELSVRRAALKKLEIHFGYRVERKSFTYKSVVIIYQNICKLILISGGRSTNFKHLDFDKWLNSQVSIHLVRTLPSKFRKVSESSRQFRKISKVL